MSNLHKNDQHRKKIMQKLNNEHIDMMNRQALKSEKARVARNRRLTLFAVVAIITFGILTKTLISQNNHLAEKEKSLNERQEALNEQLDIQEMLKLQIVKLDDDEYIEKLARKEFFLSENGEIVFTIPEKDEKDESKDKE